MKAKLINLSRSVTIQGIPGARKQFRNVEASINAQGVAIPVDKTGDEVLIPWHLIEYVRRERTAVTK